MAANRKRTRKESAGKKGVGKKGAGKTGFGKQEAGGKDGGKQDAGKKSGGKKSAGKKGADRKKFGKKGAGKKVVGGGRDDAPSRPRPPHGSDVYVDLCIERGLLFLDIVNPGPAHARRVRVAFDETLIGLDGIDVARLPVFSRLEFLPAGRRVRVLVDRVPAMRTRANPDRLGLTIGWRDDASHRVRVEHDLRAYHAFPHELPGGDDPRLVGDVN